MLKGQRYYVITVEGEDGIQCGVFDSKTRQIAPFGVSLGAARDAVNRSNMVGDGGDGLSYRTIDEWFGARVLLYTEPEPEPRWMVEYRTVDKNLWTPLLNDESKREETEVDARKRLEQRRVSSYTIKDGYQYRMRCVAGPDEGMTR